MERLAEENSMADKVGPETGGTGNPQIGTNTGTNGGNSVGSQTKRMLYRHPQDRLIGGVCGGLADLTGMDANLVRILWVVATLATGGGGILAYVALWMLLPVGTAAEGQLRPPTFALNGLNLSRTAVILIAPCPGCGAPSGV
jgi:phage shock protein C